MQIKRGIVGFNNRNEMIVSSPGYIYHLNNNSFYKETLSENDKVFGVIINGKFSICRDFITIQGHFVFGFINIEVLVSNQIHVQLIKKFDINFFNPFEAEYSLGEEVTVEISD